MLAGSLKLGRLACSSSRLFRTSTAFYCHVDEDHVTNVTFAEMGVSAKRVKALKDNGIETMFPIQKETYPPIFDGEDIIGRAKTGTGKTLAFALPLIERYADVAASSNSPKIVILAPTRELALQVAREIQNLDQKLNTVCVYGGASMHTQARQLSMPVDVVVGTPGRVTHFIEEGQLRMDNVQAFVLDEADQMLDQGFKVEIEGIMKELPETRQTLLFSATMPTWVKQISRKYMAQPSTIDLIGDQKTPEKVTHYHIPVSREQQRIVSIALLLKEDMDRKAIIFVDTKLECAEIASNNLLSQYSSIRALHGDVSQAERAATLDNFRSGKIRTLVATDVAARGLDIPGVDLVINFRPPKTAESYIHRSGRGGRAGKLGSSITLLCGPSEKNNMRYIESKSGATFHQYEITSPEEQQKAEKSALLDNILSVTKSGLASTEAIAKEITDEIGSEKALAAALYLLSSKNRLSKSFSLLTGRTGFTTGTLVDSSGNRVMRTEIQKLMRNLKITNAAIEESKTGSIVCDFSFSDLAKFESYLESGESTISFTPLSTPPVLKIDIPMEASASSGHRSRRSSQGSGSGFRGGRSFDRGNDRGGRDRYNDNRYDSWGNRSSNDRGDRSYDRGNRGGDRYERGNRGGNRGGNRFNDRGDRGEKSHESKGNDLNFDFLFD